MWSVVSFLLGASTARAELRVERLPSGLTLIVERIEDVGAVGSFLYVPRGAAGDPADAPGLAHLVEHLAFTGTQGAPATSWDSAVSRAGGWTNAWTDGYGIGLFAEVPTGAASLLVALEADRLLHSEPTPEAVRAQLGVIAAEARAAGDRPERVLLSRRWPAGHSLHVDPLGDVEALARLPFERVSDEVRDRLSPDGAVWAIVGDVDPDALLAEVSGRLHDAPPVPTAALRAGSAAAAPTALEVPRRWWMRSDVARTSRMTGWALPPSTDADAAALRLAGRMIGGRVFLGPDGGTLLVERREGRAVLRRLRRRGPGPGALDVVRRRARSEDADIREHGWARAEQLALCVARVGAPTCADDARAAEDALGPDAVQAAARRWLSERTATVLTLVPRSATAFGRAGREVQADRVDAGPPDRNVSDVSNVSGGACRVCEEVAVVPPRVPPPPRIVASISSDGMEGVALARPDAGRASAAISLFPDAPLDAVDRTIAEALLGRATGLEALGARVRVGCGVTRCRVLVEALPDTLMDAVQAVLAALDTEALPGARWWRERRTAARRWARIADRGRLTVTEAALERLVLSDDSPSRVWAPPLRADALRRSAWRVVHSRLRASRVHVALAGPFDAPRAEASLSAVAERLRGRRTPSTPDVSRTLPPPRGVPRVTRVVVVDAPGAEDVELRVAWSAPPDVELLTLAARAWGEDASSALDRTLRAELGATYGIRAEVRPLAGGSLLVVGGALPGGEASLVRTLPVLRALLEAPSIEDADIAGRTAAVRREAWKVRGSTLGLVEFASEAAALGRPIEEHWRWIDTVSDVSPEAVRASLLGVVGEPAVWVLTGDATLIEDALIAAGLPTDAVWSPRRAVHGARAR